MSLFVVDDEKCKRDGVCVAECPIGIIQLKGENQVPTPTPDADELCINCGHCVAVCPNGALSHRIMKPEECAPVRKDWLLSPEEVEHFLRARRSIRTYKDQAVKREALNKLIDIARFAPSGRNLQQVRWLVIYDSNEVQRMAGLVIDWVRYLIEEQPSIAEEMHMDRAVAAWEAGVDTICRGAPHLIVAHAPGDDHLAPSACTIALTYLELAASSFELGTCWAGYLNAAATFWPPLQQALGLPEGHKCYGAMMVGYPKYRYHRLPVRNEAQITWS
jgi:nitroreductase/NAD-dependent dihydropyrimidine dehydrogenase PreA subunit